MSFSIRFSPALPAAPDELAAIGGYEYFPLEEAIARVAIRRIENGRTKLERVDVDAMSFADLARRLMGTAYQQSWFQIMTPVGLVKVVLMGAIADSEAAVESAIGALLSAASTASLKCTAPVARDAWEEVLAACNELRIRVRRARDAEGAQ